MAGNFQQAEKDISLRQNNHSQKHNQFFRPGWLLPHLSLVPHNCTTSSFKPIYCRWIVLIVSRQTRVTLSSLSHSSLWWHWLTYSTAETEKDKEWQAMTDSECVSVTNKILWGSNNIRCCWNLIGFLCSFIVACWHLLLAQGCCLSAYLSHQYLKYIYIGYI